MRSAGCLPRRTRGLRWTVPSWPSTASPLSVFRAVSLLLVPCRPLARRAPAQRLVAWVLVATYATAASGVPLPRFATAESAEPHPCQTHRCGCATAEQCWKSCCCYTNKQKIAWAAEHGVTPPEFVVAAAQAETSAAPARACCRSKRSCGEKSPACSQSSSSASSSADTQRAGVDCSAKHSPPSSVVYVSLLQSERCRGTTPVWGGVAISLAPAAPVGCPAFDPRVSPAAPVPPPAKPHVFRSTSVPPPRAA